MQRTFIVGCPRSGTTLVQAMLARHPDVLTLPETALFEHLLGGLSWRWRDRGARAPRERASQRLGFARARGRRAFSDTLRQLGASEIQAAPPLRTAACIERFIATLDELAASAGRDMWLEKTPNHLLYIEEITEQLPDAQFVHVIRPGLDVLASIADANLCFDDNHGLGGGTKLWARRWNRAMGLHRQYVGRPGHHFVFLDDFVGNTPEQWRRLCVALSLDPEAPLAEVCDQPIADLADEPWKRSAVSGKPKRTRSKADDLFGPALQRWLAQRLVSLESLRQLCGQATGPSTPARAPGVDRGPCAAGTR